MTPQLPHGLAFSIDPRRLARERLGIMGNGVRQRPLKNINIELIMILDCF